MPDGIDSGPRIFMHHHNMWSPPLWRKRAQKASSWPSERSLFRILDANIAE
jgi:hypothetical protein